MGKSFSYLHATCLACSGPERFLFMDAAQGRLLRCRPRRVFSPFILSIGDTRGAAGTFRQRPLRLLPNQEVKSNVVVTTMMRLRSDRVTCVCPIPTCKTGQMWEQTRLIAAAVEDTATAIWTALHLGGQIKT